MNYQNITILEENRFHTKKLISNKNGCYVWYDINFTELDRLMALEDKCDACSEIKKSNEHDIYCLKCGRSLCISCIDPETELCFKCLDGENNGRK